MKKSSLMQILLYGVCLAILLFALRWLELRFIIFDHSMEIFTVAIAVIFMGLGIWLALKLAKPKVQTIHVEREVYVERPDAFVFNEAECTRLGISQRELEVLQLMSEGLSNEEIAARLFVSLPTVKSHGSRLFEKLDVRRRTQAVEKARKLNLIPLQPKYENQ